MRRSVRLAAVSLLLIASAVACVLLLAPWGLGGSTPDGVSRRSEQAAGGRQPEGVTLVGRPEARAATDEAHPAPDVQGGSQLTLAGLVLSERGEPVAAASVHCYEMSPGARPWDWSEPLASAQCDERGRWRISMARDERTAVSLVAAKDGLAGQHTHLQLDERDEIEDLGLCLFAGGALRVRVTRGTQGASGVRVGCVSAQLFGVPHDRFGVTNSSGEYVFSNVVGQVRASVQAEDGVQFGAMAHVEAGETVLVELAMPSFRRLPVSLRFLGASHGSPANVTAYIIAGRAASSFELPTDGTPVVRAVDPNAEISLGLDLPDSTRWNFKWPDARQFLRRGALGLQMQTPGSTRLVFMPGGGEGGLPDWQCELRATEHDLRIPLRTDSNGSVHCTLPRHQYEVHADGRRVGDLDFLNLASDVSVRVEDQGVIRGRYEGAIPGDGAKLQLRIESASSEGGLRGDGEFLLRPLETQDWAVTVPWPDGTKLGIQLWRARRPLGPRLTITVGGQEVVLPSVDAVAGRTLRLAPRVGDRLRVLGVLSLTSLAPPSEGDDNPTPVTFSAHIDGASGIATFSGVPPGRYSVFLSRHMADRRPLRGLAPLVVSDVDVSTSVELAPAGD